MSLIIKVKNKSLIVFDNPFYFNIAMFILVALLAYFLYQLTYAIPAVKQQKREVNKAVYYDLLRQSEIDQIKPVVLGHQITGSQWKLHDSVTEIRKSNFESLFVVTDTELAINLDLPKNIQDEEIFNNIAYQAVNYANIIQKRAPNNKFEALHLYMSEKIPSGKQISLEFDYIELSKMKVSNANKPTEVLRMAKSLDSQLTSPSIFEIKSKWCSKNKVQIAICK